jgi:NitT/TauT family transport system ATP-binding protein
MPYILEIKNINKQYIDKGHITEAIENVSFETGHGEFLSIVGPSGCGKTTLLRIIAGLISANSGSVLKTGTTTMVFQDFNKSLFPWKTVKDNILFGLENNFKKNTIPLTDYLKIVELQRFENYYPYELSGGMQQRVAIARALAYDPDIILMDEPFGSLDAQTKNRMEDELLKIWKEFNKTIIFVTHDIEEAIYLSDRIIIISPRPAKVINVLCIKLNRPRNQLATRETDQFIKHRHEIYQLLQI